LPYGKPLVWLHHFQFAGDVAEIDVEPDGALFLGVDQKEVARAAAVIGAQPLPRLLQDALNPGQQRLMPDRNSQLRGGCLPAVAGFTDRLCATRIGACMGSTPVPVRNFGPQQGGPSELEPAQLMAEQSGKQWADKSAVLLCCYCKLAPSRR
jgi:hypothetical protein